MSINKDEFINFMEDFLIEDEAKELGIKIAGEEEETPKINSLQQANFYLKLVKSIDEDVANVEELCKEEIKKHEERIAKYKSSQIEPLLRQREYFIGLLKNYTEHELADSKKRSIKLPNGTLSLSKQQPVWEYEDEDSIIETLKVLKYDEFINVKVEESINKKELKKATVVDEEGNVLAYGHKLPGITVTQREDKFTVK